MLRNRPIVCLDLAALRCLYISMHGSGEHVRTPLVFPLVRTDSFNFAPQDRAIHTLPGPDWLVLGGKGVDLGRLVAQALRARLENGERPVLRVTPYASLKGPLPQEPADGDTPFTFRKSGENFNQPAWLENAEKLLALPEERWHEAGISNTADQTFLFDEALARLAPAAPRLILDLGCGLGQITRTLALRHPQAQVVGLDASAEAIAVAARTFRLPNLRFETVDFSRQLKFAPGSVDLIVSTNALPYAQDQLGSARELFGLLAPDGLLLNHCRAEEAHLFWDFPFSLVLPSNTQIFLSDWFLAARETGRNTEILSVPLGMGAFYFRANQARPFSVPLDAVADAHRHDGPGPYAPWLSHVLLAHGRRVRRADEAALPLAQNHLERLGQVLNAVVRAPREIQRAAVVAWVCNAKMLGLLPEFLEYLEAVLPGSMPVLKPVFEASLAAGGEEGGAGYSS
jgi:SAM-dependent methyltransferase